MFFGLFKPKKKEAEVQELHFSSLKEWLAESEQVKSILAAFNNETSECISKINQSISKTESFLKELESVDLENRKAPIKLKTLVLYNKTSYVEHTKHFLSKLKIALEEIPSNQNKYDLDKIEKFTSAASEQLDNFSKQSLKAFHITSELIGKELEGVVSCISEINSSVKKIKAIPQEKIKAIKLIEKNLGIINEKERIIKSLKDEIADKQKEKQEIIKKLSDIEKKNEELKFSSEWKKKQELTENLSSLKEKLKANSSAVSNLFSPLEKVIKKWSWKEKNNKVLAYLENPSLMIKKDSKFEIINILNKIKEDTLQEKIDIDEKRKDNFLKSISEITKEKLVSFIKEEEKIQEEIEKNEKYISEYNLEFIDTNHLIDHKSNINKDVSIIEKRQMNLEREILEEKIKIGEELKIISDIKLVF